MRITLSFLAMTLLGLGGCSGRGHQMGTAQAAPLQTSPSVGDLRRPAESGLGVGDFATPLSKDLLRATNPELSDSEFESKWQGSFTSPLLLLRAFPPAYHADLAQVPRQRVPGGEGLCVGDAHPANFGFLEFEGRTVFGYNDLDDPGYCAVAIDAARYFTALRLLSRDEGLIAGLAAQYVEVVRDPQRAVAPPVQLAPDWRAIRERAAAKETEQGHLVTDDKSTPVDAATRAALVAALAGSDASRSWQIDDAVAVERDHGGSSQLKRYHLLVSRGAPLGTTIVELKQAATPGTDFGQPSQLLSWVERLPVLKNALWQVTTPSDYFYVMVGSRRFLVRDRWAMDGVNLKKLQPEVARAILLAQVSRLAVLHGEHYTAGDLADLQAWLLGTSRTLSDRWLAFYRDHLPEVAPGTLETDDGE